MGAYLSSPVTDKKSDDFTENKKYSCGLSGMQGWRISMEDAHNCVPQMDDDTGFFAVYDGHGGGEVAIYCSHHFINVLTATQEYKEGNIDAALKVTFMQIDNKLKEAQAIKELKILSQMEPSDPPLTEEDFKRIEKQEMEEKAEVEDETKLLYEEATMSIEELLAKYGRAVNATEEKLKDVFGGDNRSESSTEKGPTTKGSGIEAEENEDSQEKPEPSTILNTKESSNAKEEDVESSNKDESKKKLKKTFPKSKPTKAMDDDDSDDDDYEGFESDEAVEGSSSEEVSDEDEEDEDEDTGDEDPTNSEEPSWEENKPKHPTDDMERLGSNVEEPGTDSGTTAVVAVVRDNDLYVANAGDSRCVLSRKGGVAFDMSDDHKPEDEAELNRITAAGGHVNMQGRVNGGLNLSRALGDHLYKSNTELPLEDQMITAYPDVRHVRLEPDDEFIVIACDGIWNVLNSQEVVDFVRSRLYPDVGSEVDQSNATSEDVKLSEVCEELFQKCIAPDTSGDGTGCDNMTCIIVRFDRDWLLDRHLARGPLIKDPKTLSPGRRRNSLHNDEDSSMDAKGDAIIPDTDLKLINKQEIVETFQDIHKRPHDVAHESPCVNGEGLPAKRAKAD